MRFIKCSFLFLATLLLWRCEVPRCNDGKLNGDEQEIDCGGLCPPCYSCSDGYKNQGESGIDCGGYNCEFCHDEWQPFSQINPPVFFEDISILDTNLIFAVGGNQILKTTDNGKSWVAIGPPDAPAERQMRYVKFFDEQNGYAISETFNSSFGQWLATYLVTHDGGQSWAVHKNKTNEVYDAYFTNGRIFVMAYGVQVSEDDGESFQQISNLPSGSEDLVPFGIKFFDENNGYLLANQNNDSYSVHLSLTSDGGQTWQPFKYMGRFNWGGFTMYSKDIILAVPYFETNFKISTDGGQTWKPISSPDPGVPFPYYIFKDAQTGYVVGDGPADNEYYSYKTSDGGVTWVPFGRYNHDRLDNYEYARQIKQVKFYGEHIYAVGARVMKAKQ